MRSVALILTLIIFCILSVDAATDVSAVTVSNLVALETDLMIMRTISQNIVSTPDLYFKGLGDTQSYIKTDSPSGGGEYTQSMHFSAGQGDGYMSGFTAESRAFSWKGVTDVKTGVTGTISTSVCDPAANPSVQDKMVHSTSAGMTIANVGTTNYDLTLTGGHNTETNSIPFLPLETKTRPLEYSVSFELNPLEIDKPADLFNQDVMLNFMTNDEGVAYYGFDFARELEIGDINCKSEMSYFNQGNSE